MISEGNPYKLSENQVLTDLPYEDRNGFSQHAETGIIKLLVDNIINCDKTFLEIGWGNGLGNMTRDLIIQDWGGVGIDMYQEPHPDAPSNEKFTYKQCKITPSNVLENINGLPKNLDFFSLDIDSYDFEVAEVMLNSGYRPKVVCVEFNPRFGNAIEASFPFKEIFKKKLYRKQGIYGASIKKYISLWEKFGYKFFTYDSSLTNLFFYNPEELNSMVEYPTYTLENFPIKEDKNRQIILDHGMWVEELDKIYRDYK